MDNVRVIYRGPSGCLIADGVEFLQNQITAAPRELVEWLRQYESQHILEDAPDEENLATGGDIGPGDVLGPIGEESPAPLILPSPVNGQKPSLDAATPE